MIGTPTQLKPANIHDIGILGRNASQNEVDSSIKAQLWSVGKGDSGSLWMLTEGVPVKETAEEPMLPQ